MLKGTRKPLQIGMSVRTAPRTLRDQLAKLAPRRAIEIIGPELVRTPRLVIRPLRASDRKTFVEALAVSRRELGRYMDLWHTGDTDADVFERQIELTRLGAMTARAWRRGAFLADGRLAGCFNLSRIDYGLEFTAEASWWVRSDLGRMGLGTEGVSAVVDYAIEDLPGGLMLSRVEAVLHPENEASHRLASRVGMRLDPRESPTVDLNGTLVKHVVYAKVPMLKA